MGIAPVNSLTSQDTAIDGARCPAPLAEVTRYPFTIVALLWFTGVIVINVFDKDLWKMVSFLALLARWGLIGVGLVLALMVAVLHMRSSINYREAVTALGIFMAGLVAHFGAGEYLSMNVGFRISQRQYE